MTNEITQNLPKLINESYERANKLADSAKAHAEGAITEAQHCGRLLNKAKDTEGHGNWEDWLAENCPDISQSTACRYMKLANLSHVIDFSSCTSLTNAYKLAEILPEPDQAKQQSPSTPKPDAGLDLLQRACQYFNTHDLFRLEQPDRQRWKERLKPLVELYEKL